MRVLLLGNFLLGNIFVISQDKGRNIVCSVSDVPDLEKSLGIPSLILKKFLDLFCHLRSSAYVMPNHEFQKLVNYIIVFFLTLHRFEVDADTITSDLIMTKDAIRSHFFSIGCQLRKRSSGAKGEEGEGVEVKRGSSYVLKAPLQIYTPRKRR